MPISGVYISNRQVCIEVKSQQRPPRPHSVTITDMDVKGGASPTHVLPAPFTSRPHTPPATWGSMPSSPDVRGRGGGEGGAMDGLDSLSLSPRTTNPPGHSRLPSTDSGIQADAGWDSLSRSYGKTFSSKAGLTSPSATLTSPIVSLTAPTVSLTSTTVSTPGNVRTIDIEVLGRGKVGEADGMRKGTGEVFSSDVSTGRLTSPVISNATSGRLASQKHAGPLHTDITSERLTGAIRPNVASERLIRPGRVASDINHVSPHSKAGELGSSRTRSNDFGSHQSRASDFGSRQSRSSELGPLERSVSSPERSSRDKIMSSSCTSFSASSRVLSPERKLGPLNLLSSSTPVIPSRSYPPGQDGQGGDWVVGGRNNFPPHSRTMLAQAEFTSRDMRSPDSEITSPGKDRNPGTDVRNPGNDLRSPGNDVRVGLVAVTSLSGQGGNVTATNPSHRGVHHPSGSPPHFHQQPQYFDQGQSRHPQHQGVNIVTQHYRPRVNPAPTRFVSPRGMGMPPAYGANVASVGAMGSSPARTFVSVPVSHEVSGASLSPGSGTSPARVGPSSHGETTRAAKEATRCNPKPSGPHSRGVSVVGQQGVTGPSSQGVIGPSSQGVPEASAQGVRDLSSQEVKMSTSPGVSSTAPGGVRVPPTIAFPASRSKVSPVLLRESLKGRLFLSQPTGVVHNIPIKHVDTCSACLKTTTSSVSLPTSNAFGMTRAASPARAASSCGSDFTSTVTSTLASAGRPVTAVVRPTLTSNLTRPVAPSGPHEGVLKLLEGSGLPGKGAERKIPILDLRKEVPWKERRTRIDSALQWLRNELESLRAMDTALMTQFRRCQDTIESLKQQQRDAAWDNEWWWGADGSEFDEEEEAWEDWEIAEFERKWAENPDAKEIEIKLVPATAHASTGIKDVATNQANLTPLSDKNGPTSPTAKRNGQTSPATVKQDVEVTV